MWWLFPPVDRITDSLLIYLLLHLILYLYFFYYLAYLCVCVCVCACMYGRIYGVSWDAGQFFNLCKPYILNFEGRSILSVQFSFSLSFYRTTFISHM